MQAERLTEMADFGKIATSRMRNHSSPLTIKMEFIMPVEKVCVVCGSSFTVPPCRALTAKACSDECAISVRAKSRERKATSVCPGCGVEFNFPRSQKGSRVYCSDDCRYNSEHSRLKMGTRVTGDKNPMWIGGETLHCEGYVYKRTKDHPFSKTGYVLKHRLVAEAMLREQCPDSPFLSRMGEQQYLSPGVSVHHLDGNRKNNAKRNLLVCTPSAHRILHCGTKPEDGTYWPKDAKIKLGKMENL